MTRGARREAMACLLALAVFFPCFGAAIALYPGGTWYDRHAVGHSLARNFVCDLMQPIALNGQPASLGSALAQLGTLAMLVAGGAFWLQVARLESPPTWVGRWMRRVGIVGCALGLGIPLTPSNRFHEIHLFAVLASFLPILLASLAAGWICLRIPARPLLPRLGAAWTLLFGAASGLTYGWAALPLIGVDLQPSADLLLSLPLWQRLANVGLVLWMLSVSMPNLRAR